MADQDERLEALRGKEQYIFNLVHKSATPEQWATWLRDPLEHAATAGDLGIVKRLLKAGADVAGREDLVCDVLLTSTVASDDNDGDSTIHLAAALDHDKIVQQLLAKGADKDALDSEGRSPLRVAVEHGRLFAAKALVAAGADVNLRLNGDDECAPLDLAAINGDSGIVRVLVKNGADMNAADSRGCTALHRAAFYNNAGAVNNLVGSGANVDATDRVGWTPLHDASAEGSSHAIAALLRHGADARKLDSTGRAPLHLAAERGHLLAAKSLVAAGADVSLRYGNSESSALDFAATEGHLDVLRAVIPARSADVNATASDGRTTLHRAAFFNQAGVVDVLVEAGANLHVRDDSLGWTPLHDAAAEGSPNAIVALARHNADKNALDSEGCTPLHLAAGAGHAPAVRALLDAGADLSLRFGDNELSALELAVSEGYWDTLREFIEHGAELNAATSGGGRTALHHAAFLDEDSMIDGLVEAGAAMEAPYSDGWTPLHVAAMKGSSGAITSLLRHGANQSALDNDGRAPLHLAVEYGHLNAANILLRAGVDVSLRSGDESSALDMAAVKGRLRLMRLIILHGADVNAGDSQGYTALHRAAQHNTAEAIDVLVGAEAHVQASDQAGWTPLHDASAQGSSHAVSALLRHGANQRALDKAGRAPLHLAAEHGHLRTTEYLLAAGVDVDLRFGTSECSALDFATVEGHLDVMRAIIRHGADVNGVDSGGRTALHRAAFFHQRAAVDVLIDAGASVDAPDCCGRTPRDVASGRDSNKAAPAFVEHGASMDAEGNTTSEESPVSLESGENGDTKKTAHFFFGEAAGKAVVAAGSDSGAQTVPFDHHSDKASSTSSVSPPERVEVLQHRQLADRAWSRRCFLVLCRAYPDRVRLNGKDNQARGSVASSAEAKGADTDGSGDAGENMTSSARTRPPCAARTGAGLDGVVGWLLKVEEGCLFRRVVGFL